MSTPHARPFSRRRFLGGLTLAGTAGLLGLRPRPVAAEPPPETTQLRLHQLGSSCQTPVLVAEALLQSEGFTDVQYVKRGSLGDALATGQVDIGLEFAARNIVHVGAGKPIVTLAGAHIGCWELFGTDRIRTIRDLKGKTVVVNGLEEVEYFQIAIMAAYIGLAPRTDITWVTHPHAAYVQLLAEGKVDALATGPPLSLELREKQIGHVIVNSNVDRPWSQYFCCMIVGNKAFVRTNPVATKRAVRALVKATDLCALEPERAAQLFVDQHDAVSPNAQEASPVGRYAYALQTMQEIPYGRWREYNPEDTVRFYALQLHEAAMIKASPQQIIAQGTDWRFL